MKSLFSKIAILGITVLTLTFTACDRKEDADEPEIASQDNTNALFESDDMVNFSVEVMSEQNANMNKTASTNRETEVSQSNTVCNATITLVKKTSSTSGTITVDFGSTPKTCSDGRTRQGKVIISFTGKYGESGKTQIITAQDYYVNGNKVEGTKTLSSSVDNGKYITNINVTGGKVTYTDGNFFTWNSTRTRTYDTKNTLDLNDDVMTVSGTANGTSRNGIAYTANITKDLTYTFACAATGVGFPISGTLEIIPAGSSKRTIDYGNGECDRKVTITIGTRTIEYEVKK